MANMFFGDRAPIRSGRENFLEQHRLIFRATRSFSFRLTLAMRGLPRTFLNQQIVDYELIFERDKPITNLIRIVKFDGF